MKNKGRKLVIGDIHGGYLALLQVMERAEVCLADELIFLGDYVDGWTESPEVLECLMALKERQQCVFLRGNHDQLLLDWLQTGKDNPLWLSHGGNASVARYKDMDLKTKAKHIAFLEALENYHLDDKQRLFVHAGFTNIKGVDYEYFDKLLYWDRTLWELALALDPYLEKTDKRYPPRLLLYHEIFIGHTPVTRIGEVLPMQKANVWNVDTGAAFYGPLTIMDVDTKEYWQSDALPTLYPNVQGRVK